MKHALTAATLLLVAGSALGCGGSEATSETTQQDYCDAYNAYFAAMVDLGLDASDAEVIEQIKSWGEDLEELGPPEGMPEDARAGRAKMLELIDQIDEDSTEEEVTAIPPVITELEVAERLEQPITDRLEQLVAAGEVVIDRHPLHPEA